MHGPLPAHRGLYPLRHTSTVPTKVDLPYRGAGPLAGPDQPSVAFGCHARWRELQSETMVESRILISILKEKFHIHKLQGDGCAIGIGCAHHKTWAQREVSRLNSSASCCDNSTLTNFWQLHIAPDFMLCKITKGIRQTASAAQFQSMPYLVSQGVVLSKARQSSRRLCISVVGMGMCRGGTASQNRFLRWRSAPRR